MAAPIQATCDRSFRARLTQGKREPGNVFWIVLHDEEASTAKSAAVFFTTPAATGSAHLCVDDTICYRTLERAAYKTALHCAVFNIPPVFVFASGLQKTQPGVTTHREVTKAFGGTHSDPGPFWPRRRFMRLVREFHAELTV